MLRSGDSEVSGPANSGRVTGPVPPGSIPSRARTLQAYSDADFETRAHHAMPQPGARGRLRSSSLQSVDKAFLPPPLDPASGCDNPDNNTGWARPWSGIRTSVDTT